MKHTETPTEYDVPSPDLLDVISDPPSLVASKAFYDIRQEIHQASFSPDVQHQLLDAMLQEWPEQRDARLEAGSASWEVPTELYNAVACPHWRVLTRSFLVASSPQGPRNLDPGVVERLIHEAANDRRLYTRIQGYNAEGPGSYILSQYFEGRPRRSPELQRAFDTLFANPGNPPSERLLTAAQNLEGVVVPMHAPVRLARQLPQGRDRLREVRGAVDGEVWDALCPHWRGTIAELKEACSLV